MTPFRVGLFCWSWLLFQGEVGAQSVGGECFAKFTSGQSDFVLDTDDSVKQGATYLSSPEVRRAKDCVWACCKEPRCNLALIEKDGEDELVKHCFLFDCVYKQAYACKFARKEGFTNFMLESVSKTFMDVRRAGDGDEDKPPIANAGHARVVQPHEVVMLEGNQSEDDHKIVSYVWSLVSGNPSFTLEKTHLDDQVQVSELIPGKYVFQLTVTDSAGQSDSAQVTILVLTQEQSESHCLVPMKIGPCRGSFARWHYNAASGSCESFLFGGCRENRNNYLTQDECKKACEGVTESLPSPGGRKILPTSDCNTPCQDTQFTCDNRCCIDKGLECDQKKQCEDGSDEASCKSIDETFTRLLNIQIEKNKGKDMFSRKFAERQESDKSESGTIAIAVLLGVAIAIVLAILGYCFLKNKKERNRQPQRVVVNGSTISTTGDTERLVYNSTTKPI
ncbi:kunitz-type protease inhibitor 1a isoform X2 [Amia ocellicauda]|uniref:kunitz-type protease inhibitor 1a isoform X2 n=1 Tax=Amia ocellicauda TaxID=2972642 RepID=UPI00346486F0